jgi:uncharacterized protein (TIGR02996 family)
MPGSFFDYLRFVVGGAVNRGLKAIAGLVHPSRVRPSRGLNLARLNLARKEPETLLTGLEAAFVQALTSAPEDDTARAVYADWLEEHGQAERARLMRWPLDLGAGVKMRFAGVPRGTFWMGGGGGKPGDRRVEIAAGFALGIYPVTQEQWQAVMGNNPSHFSRTGRGKDKAKGVSEADLRQFPVEQVSWGDVQQFLAKVNETNRGSEWTYRLPAEAEWEYACRGGDASSGGEMSQADCAFSFYLERPTSDLSSAQANFDGNYPDGGAPKGPDLERTTKVGSYRPNRLGLFDMHGNVWEWCNDWYEEGASRVIRGGSWSLGGQFCRASHRYGHAPAGRDIDVGFRVARVPSGG